MRSPPPGSRLAVIDDIASAVDLTTGGTRARTVVVTAGPGVGKTHALRELAGRPLGRATRWAVADDLSWRQPYAVAATLLGVPVSCPVPLDFVTSLDAVVDSLCAEEPQLLIVDDAHNADSGTLEFLGSLSAVARDLPLAILLARRHLPLRASLARLLSRPWVAEWHLPAMDEAELAALCHQQLGAWPDRALADLLARSCGNPLHARAMLDELRAAGNVVVADERATVRGAVGTVSSVSLETAVGQQLSLLDAQSRALVQKVAVWGGPVTLDELALLDDVPPTSLIGAAQTAIDAGVIIAAAQGGLTVTHDVYADVAYDGLDQSLRRVLHTAIARHHESRGRPQLVAHHLLAAGADGSTAATAISDAQGELVGAPAVAADLLDTAVASDTPLPTRTLELDLATALARSGQLARATEVAEQGLAACSDPAILARLHRVLLFSLIAQGRTSQVLELIAQTLRLPVDSPTRDVLLDLQRYVRLLAGEAPVSPEPYPVSDPGNVSEMVTEALRRFLTGDGIGGLGLALAASRRESDAGEWSELSTSADIWPPFIELYIHGPAAADALLDSAIQRRAERGVGWMTAYHDFTRAGIALYQGRLCDAVASADAGLERAAGGDLGWTSLAEGTRAIVDVYRGEFSRAATRLDRFAASGLPDQFGLPVLGQARVLLLEMQRKLRPALAAARRCWDHTADLGLDGWLPVMAVDCARIAHRAADTEFSREISAALAGLPSPPAPAMVGPVGLARAVCAGDPGAILGAAVPCAHSARELGDVLTESAAWEEAACAAASAGDKAAARGHGHRAVLLCQNMGAAALSARITSRLRASGVRMDARTVRERPRAGWEALTRTEMTVAELVAAGHNGAEIARELCISPRTVQTHVSHALHKLDLRTRVELAALVAARGQRRR